MTSIASENNVSINTVQRVLGNCSHRFIDSYEYLPAHFAFDEFKGVDRQLHFICLDGDSHQVVQILRTRYKKTLLKYFGNQVAIVQEIQGAAKRTSRLNQFSFINFMLLQFD